MSFPKYERYKESGVEWLGEVPSGWQIALAKRFLTVKSGDMISASEEAEQGHPIVGGNGVRGYTEKINTPGDTLVIGRVGALCGCVHHIEEDFWASEHAYRVIEKRPLSRRYLYHLLSAIDLNRLAVRTAQPLLNTDIVEMQWIAMPPLPEQRAIAAFLDRETARIDALVEAQRRLIELLKEKRQAVISHAVTKGLDPTVPMKDSGIEWLGQVPAHWNVVTIRRIAKRVQTGTTPSIDPASDQLEDGLDWFTPGDFGPSFILGNASKRVSLNAVASGEVRVFPSDSVLVVGIGATLGRIGLSDRECSANQQINAISADESIVPMFLAYALSDQEEIMRKLSNASTIGIMNQDKTKDLWICRPPFEEQMMLVAEIGAQLRLLDELSLAAEAASELLRERRSALISAAVTGKIDVRNLDQSAEAA